MKALFSLLAAAALFTSCKNDAGSGLLNPNAKVYINGVAATQSATAASTVSKAGQQLLTPKEVVEKAQLLISTTGELGVADWNRDVANARIIGAGSWVVIPDGRLCEDFIASRHNILVTINWDNRPVDTIAYVPNAIMERIEREVRAAYAEQDFEMCYRLFEEGYQFTPITGAQFKALKEQGRN